MPTAVHGCAGTTCVGHTHAHDDPEAPGMCGGTANRRVLGKRSNCPESRVDHADREGWRGAVMPGGLTLDRSSA